MLLYMEHGTKESECVFVYYFANSCLKKIELASFFVCSLFLVMWFTVFLGGENVLLLAVLSTYHATSTNYSNTVFKKKKKKKKKNGLFWGCKYFKMSSV